MGGKTGTTTSTTTIPPEVLARYNSVNATAQNTASQPFQQYSTDPNAFVAPLNQQQNAAIGGINTYANAAQPGYQAGMDTTGSAINQINAGQNVAQPYFQGAQTMAAGTLPQYQQAAGLAGAAMTPLQQATYAAQPGYQAAQAGTMAAGAGTGQTIGQLGNISQGYNAPNYQAGVQGYMNPFLQNAMGSTAAMMQNQNQQQQNQLQGNAISSGAFGGDRGNIAQAALMGQQNLAMGQTLGQMANTGYQSAAQNYMSGLGQQGALAGQQGAMYGQLGNLANQYGQLGGQAQQALINAGQAQQQGAANIANIAGQGMSAAGQYGQLGTAAQNAALQGVPLSLAAGAQQGQLGAGAQAAGLAGAQAQLGAGTLGQQTTQAGDTALYNQFQQQQAYPFQVSQFLANIAEGTGALSGSSTTGTSPMPIFSDRRLKEDIKRVGTADNGLPIYKFKYKGDHSEQTHVGFMADEVEKVHPEAVGLAGGYKTVDYEKASEPVRHHNAFGGLNTNPASTLSGAGAGSEQTNQDPSILFPIEHGGTAGDHAAGFGVNHNYSPSTGEGGLMGNIGHSIGNMTGSITGDTGVGGTEGQAMYAHGGLVPSSMGGHVGTEHMGEGYADGGYTNYTAFGKYDPYDINSFYNLLNKNQAAQKLGAGMLQMGGNPGMPSHVPQANLPVGQLHTAGSLPPIPESILQQGLGAANEVEQGGNLFTGAKDSLSKAYDYLKTLNNPTAQARGGLVGYASGGDIPYEDSSSDSKLDIPDDKNKHTLMTSQNPTGSTSQTGLGFWQALALPDEIAKLGSTASGLASGIGTAATLFGLSGGGTVGREHHDGSEGNVVGGESGLDDKMQYKIAPQALADMDPVQQQIVKGIYGPESGNRYNVLNGGEEFDTSQGHPNRVGKGGQSTAAGAGQFINETWNRVTGGAPMTPEYQDAATLKLANDDYKARTGRDLQQDVSEKGFSPEVKSALAPTWTSLGQKQDSKDDGGLLGGLGKMFGIGSAQAQEPQQQSNQQGGLLPQTGLFSEQTIIPLLSGLGAMASSKSPYLGAALLQGIGGGAKAYEDVRTQQMERNALSPVISQRDIATTNALQTGLMQYNAMRDANGQPPISMQEFAKLSGYQGGLPSDAQAVTGQTGVFGQPTAAGTAPTGEGNQSKVGLAPAPTLQQMHTGTVVRDGVEIPLGNDPASLQAFVNKYKGVGGSGSFLEGQVKAYEDRLNDINTTKLTRDVNGSSVPAMGVLAASRKAALAENVTKNIQSQYNDSTDFEKNYQVNNQLIDNIAEYSRLANMNRATPELAEAIGRLSSIPGFDKYITPEMATLQKANDSGTKSAVISALQTLSENSGTAQKSVLQEALHAVATPGINPGSRHDIVANAKAKLEYQHDLNNAWLAEGDKNNGQYPEPVSFTSTFNKANPYKNYLEEAKKNIPPFAGQAQSEGNRTVVRTGVVQDGLNAGKRVIQYSDGSTEVQ